MRSTSEGMPTRAGDSLPEERVPKEGLPKVIIQIPCYNEEATLGITLSALPRQIPGAGKVEWLIINDGSRDRTVEVARQHGVDYIVNLPRNTGLANAFMTGVSACLRAGADIIVNTDADNQYCAGDIPKLIAPLLEGQAEIVIGTRPIGDIQHFSRAKKFLQRLGSTVVRLASGADIEDAPSGFRAMTREAALRLRIFSKYTYTLEMIIQAGQKGIPLVSVPVRVNPDLRPSRLVKSMGRYVWRSARMILRIFILYRPFRFFLIVGAVPSLLGALLCVRWLLLNIFEYPYTGRTHVPSLLVAVLLLLIGFQIWVFGFIADLLAANRTLLEDVTLYLRRQEMATEAGASQQPRNPASEDAPE
jgi:glycosyltransferase involved in cell wall biosynthesis